MLLYYLRFKDYFVLPAETAKWNKLVKWSTVSTNLLWQSSNIYGVMGSTWAVWCDMWFWSCPPWLQGTDRLFSAAWSLLMSNEPKERHEEQGGVRETSSGINTEETAGRRPQWVKMPEEEKIKMTAQQKIKSFFNNKIPNQPQIIVLPRPNATGYLKCAVVSVSQNFKVYLWPNL